MKEINVKQVDGGYYATFFDNSGISNEKIYIDAKQFVEDLLSHFGENFYVEGYMLPAEERILDVIENFIKWLQKRKTN